MKLPKNRLLRIDEETEFYETSIFKEKGKTIVLIKGGMRKWIENKL